MSASSIRQQARAILDGLLGDVADRVPPRDVTVTHREDGSVDVEVSVGIRTDEIDRSVRERLAAVGVRCEQ